MKKELIKLANELDRRGLTKEADALDSMIKFAGRRVVAQDQQQSQQSRETEYERAIREGGNANNAAAQYVTKQQHDEEIRKMTTWIAQKLYDLERRINNKIEE